MLLKTLGSSHLALCNPDFPSALSAITPVSSVLSYIPVHTPGSASVPLCLDNLVSMVVSSVTRVAAISSAASKGVFQTVWSYSHSIWKTVFAELKAHKQHDYCYLVAEICM